MKMLAVILARGGSKRLPGKNIKKLDGIELIGYTIKTLKEVSQINDIIVSTDSKEIQEVSIKYGASCPFDRPFELAQDTSSSEDSLLHALLEMERINKTKYDTVILAQPTSPFTKPQTIQACIELSKKYDSVITVCEVHHKIGWIGIESQGHFKRLFPQLTNEQRKQLAPSGNIYIMCRENILNKNIYNGTVGCFQVDSIEATDIDNQIDFDFAQFILSKKENK